MTYFTKILLFGL